MVWGCYKLDAAELQRKAKRPPKWQPFFVMPEKFARLSDGAKLEALMAVWKMAGLKME
jgi:hypothetical protein